MLPIPPLLDEQLRRQEECLAERFPQTEWLLPSPVASRRQARRVSHRSRDGQPGGRALRPPSRDPHRRREAGAGHHPHLFRHHLGTSMVNENIPLTVIQEVLDHGSMEMTARYARMHEETVKQAVKRWHERVNIRGERIALPVDGPLEEAAWMKERIARAKQALPNGYCGLPLVQTCPHPNACLSCESFLTDGSLRAVHEQHQAETRRLLEKARKQGSVRLIEVLERDERSLTSILDGLDQIEPDHADAGGGEELDLRDLAQARAETARDAGAVRSPLSSLTPPRDARWRPSSGSQGALRELDRDGRGGHVRRGRQARRGLAARSSTSTPSCAPRSRRCAPLHAAAPARLPVRQRASDASLRARLRAALDENQRQREEIAAAARGARARARPRARARARPPGASAMSGWPAPARDAALHGVAGEFVRRTAPHTESTRWRC